MYAAARADHDAALAALEVLAESNVSLPSADDVIERWDALELPVQRAVVERLIESIVVAPGQRGYPGFNEDRLGDPVWRA